MAKRILLLFVLLMSLSSCAVTETKVILKHPETSEFKECRTGVWAVSSREKDACVKKYEALGYKVWGER